MEMEPLSKKPRPYDDAYGAASAPGMNGDPSMYSMPGMPPNNYGVPGAMPGENGDQECRRYNTPEGCPYGASCRFKHGPNDQRELSQSMLSMGGAHKPCTKFFSTAGCPYGDRCHFLHYVPGGINALGLPPLNTLGSTAAVMVGAGRKQIGAATDPSLTVNGYKTRLCNRYNTPEGCRFGDRCHFAHGESDLRPSTNFRSINRAVTTEPAMQSAPAMQTVPAMYDTAPVSYGEGPSATYDNSTSFANSASYANSVSYTNAGSYFSNALVNSAHYGEPTPPGVVAGMPPMLNSVMPMASSTMPMTSTEAPLATGPVDSANVQQTY